MIYKLYLQVQINAGHRVDAVQAQRVIERRLKRYLDVLLCGLPPERLIAISLESSSLLADPHQEPAPIPGQTQIDDLPGP